MNRNVEPVIADLRLERFHLGELPPGEMKAVEDRLARDPDLRARLEALQASNQEFSRAHPAADVTPAIRQRLAASPQPPLHRKRSSRSLWLASLAPLAAVTLVVLAVWLPNRPGVDGGDDELRMKDNGASLVVYRKTENGSARLEPGARVRQGDQVRIGYRAAGRTQGAILSVDRAGVVTQHLPQAGLRSVSLQSETVVMLDSAYELDAAPGWERIYFITGGASFDLGPILASLRETAAKGSVQSPPRLAVPTGLDQAVFTLSKDDRE